MNDQYEVLQVSPSATDEEIENAYHALKKKYEEERWKEGSEGKKAVRMLEKIDFAYEEIKRERREKAEDESGMLKQVRINIGNENFDEAQRILDSFNERGAEWHFLQSVVFFRKNWYNESKKQLEIAIELDPSNERYKKSYDSLCNNLKKMERENAERTAPAGPAPDEQMGGNTCTTLWNTCACLSWMWCCCNSCR